MLVLYDLIFYRPTEPLTHCQAVCLEVASLHVLFYLGKDLFMRHKYKSY